MGRINEASIDAIVNGVVGFGLFDNTTEPTELARSALAGSRRDLRRVMRLAILETIRRMEED